MEHSLGNALLAANFLQDELAIKNKPHRICMMNDAGKIIKKFRSIEQVATKLNLDVHLVRKACNNGTALAGFKWSWN